MLLKHGETVEVRGFPFQWLFLILALLELKEADTLTLFPKIEQLMTAHYIASLGGYRTLYLLNWIWRYFTEDNYSQWLIWTAGLVQNGLYAEFFYYYVKSMWYKKKMQLPKSA